MSISVSSCRLSRLDILDEYVSPVSAAELFLSDAVAKRKDVLMKTVAFLGTIIHNDTITSKQKDGVLHMLGVIGNVLIKKKTFANQLESMIVQYLFPELQGPTAFLRARACYAIRNFSKLEYSNPENATRCLTYLIHCLCNDTSVPVQVEAAMALNLFISDTDAGEAGKAVIVPHLQVIVMRIIEIIRKTEIDDVMIVLQKIVGLFDQELQPIAVQMTSQLVEFFKHVICAENTPSDESKAEERTVAAMGVLNTLDTIVSCMGEKAEVTDDEQRRSSPAFCSLDSRSNRTNHRRSDHAGPTWRRSRYSSRGEGRMTRNDFVLQISTKKFSPWSIPWLSIRSVHRCGKSSIWSKKLSTAMPRITLPVRIDRFTNPSLALFSFQWRNYELFA